MFKSLLTLIVFSLTTLPLQALEIVDKLSAEKILKPHLYRLTISIKTEAKTEGEVLNTLTAADNGIEMLNIPYSGGYYKIYPLKVWDKNSKTYRFEGFEGVVSYTFEFKNPEEQKRVFELLENIKRNYPISYSVIEEGWIIPQRVLERVEEKLKEDILKEAKQKAEEYGKILNKICRIKEIRFSDFSPIHRAGEEKGIITPKAASRVVKITASVVFDCR